MTKTIVWWKQNRLQVLRTLSDERGGVDQGPMGILLGIGLGIILLAALVGVFKFAFSSTTSAISSSGAFEIQTGVRQVASPGNYGTGDLTPALISAASVPSNMIVPGNTSTLQGPTGTSFYTVTGNYSTFSITLSGITSSACMRILEQTTGGNSWYQVMVNGSSITQPVTVQMAQGVCSSGMDTITWISD
ncbi:MAG: type 4 pilus major pilin [Nitrospiraceae bacterium]|nr:type 4 pilus major pilin [Nitrospiraceae bacterium]